MTHQAMKIAPRRRLAVLIPLVVMLSAAGCSSSDSGGTDASSAGPNLPTATSTAATTPGATGSPGTPTGNGTKAVCARVVKIIQDSSRSAISTLTPALQTGDQKQIAAAQVKAHAYYRQAADRLRKEAPSADAALRKQIVNAAAYFDKAAANPSLPGADNSLATLSQTCSA